MSQPTGVSTFAITHEFDHFFIGVRELCFAQANAHPEKSGRAPTFPTRRKNYFLKSLPSNPESFRDKTANTHAKQPKIRQDK